MADHSSPPARNADDERFEAVAGDLYAQRPEDFAAARNAAVKQARASKEGRALAQRLAALRRPSQSAWYLNLLSRKRRSEVEGFVALGEALQQAQAAGDAAGLQRLMSERRSREDALVRAAGALAAEAGATMTAAQEREVRETLGAALALREVASELRDGRLLKPVSYAGFGPLVAIPAVAPLRRSVPAGEKHPQSAEALSVEPADGAPGAEAQAAQVTAAQAAVEAASRALEDALAVREADDQLVAELRMEVARLETLLREARPRLAAAEAASVRSQQEYDRASQVHQRAVDRLERTERDAAR